MDTNIFYIAIFNNINHSFTGRLCKLFTGYADYHVGITDGLYFWDQDLLFRKRKWKPKKDEDVTLIKCPVQLSSDYLDNLVLDNVERLCDEKSIKNIYGYLEYIRIGLTRLGFEFKHNVIGVVCSGRVRNILYENGWSKLGNQDDLEPSPADLRRALTLDNCKIVKQGNLH